jgi:uncharacterized protein YkwD
MRGLWKVFAVLVALTALGAATFAAAGPGPAGDPTASMSPAAVTVAFEWAIDVERAHNFLPPLYVDPVESAQAANWSSMMAFTGTLAEDPNSSASIAEYDPNWQAWGENVGVGPDASAIEAALMASPPHRANILGNFTHMGVGVVITNGRIWVTERFFR